MTQEDLARCYEENYDSLLETARLLLGDIGEAEDAVQETFEQLFSRLDKYDESKSRLLTWVRRSVRHRCIDKLRTRENTPYTRDHWRGDSGEENYTPSMEDESNALERSIRREEWAAKLVEWVQSDEEVQREARNIIRDYYVLQLGTFAEVCRLHNASPRWGWYKVKSAFKRWRERLADRD